MDLQLRGFFAHVLLNTTKLGDLFLVSLLKCPWKFAAPLQEKEISLWPRSLVPFFKTDNGSDPNRKSSLRATVFRDPLGATPVSSPAAKSARAADDGMMVDAAAASAVLSGMGGSAAGGVPGGSVPGVSVPGGVSSGSAAGVVMGDAGLPGAFDGRAPVIPNLPAEFCETT